ncbi:RNA-directed DNA polymerase, eukaryota, reverse transcriptase zinc-binding domain protein [Tanacetum coccineum]
MQLDGKLAWDLWCGMREWLALPKTMPIKDKLIVNWCTHKTDCIERILHGELHSLVQVQLTCGLERKLTMITTQTLALQGRHVDIILKLFGDNQFVLDALGSNAIAVALHKQQSEVFQGTDGGVTDRVTSDEGDDPGLFYTLNTLVDQRLRVVGFNLEGDAAEWFRWMSRNKLITTWEGFLESVQNRFGPCKYEDPQGALSKLLQKDSKEDVVESGDISSLNSLIGQGGPCSLQLWGMIGLGTVHVLIDNGSTYNFVRPDVVEKICLPVQSSKPFKVYIESGETLLYESICSRVTLSMQGLIMEVDLYVLPTKGPDIVLGRDYALKGKEQVVNFPKNEHEGEPVEQPLAICDTRIVLQKCIPVRQFHSHNVPEDYVNAHNAAQKEVGVGLLKWDATFEGSHAIFQPFMISDHSPALLVIPYNCLKKLKSFTFANYTADKPEFIDEVARGRKYQVEGHKIYCVTKKLKHLKSIMNKLNWKHRDLTVRVDQLRVKLQEIQVQVKKNPYDKQIKSKAIEILDEYNEAMKDEEKLLAQKASVEWLNEEDKNSSFFHKVIKGRRSRNRVAIIRDENWFSLNPNSVKQEGLIAMKSDSNRRAQGSGDDYEVTGRRHNKDHHCHYNLKDNGLYKPRSSDKPQNGAKLNGFHYLYLSAAVVSSLFLSVRGFKFTKRGFCRSDSKGRNNNGGTMEQDIQFCSLFLDWAVQSNVLGEPSNNSNIVMSKDLFCNTLNKDEAVWMVREVTNNEIKEALFDIGDNRAPWPNGFSSLFFKKAWRIVGDDVCETAKEFFCTGQMLGELNATLISLVPKVATPNKLSDFRPIACCNVLYKCITKVITNTIKDGLKKLVQINQNAFIPDRLIQDNILLSQELLRGYGRKNGAKRCAMKIDLQKAYNTVSWNFLEFILVKFGFHKKMVGWIMKCMQTAKFSICINGERHGYFKGERDVRQGDPMSPYMFNLIMEMLILLLQRKIRGCSDFKFHQGCREMKLVNLCFADDLMIFCHGDTKSTRLIKC